MEREDIIDKLYEIIKDYGFSIKDVTNIEKIIYKTSDHKKKIYRSRMQSLMINCAGKSVKNTDIIQILKNYQIDIPKGYDLFPTKWLSTKEKIEKRELESIKDITHYSKDVTCPKCKNNTVRVNSVQLRSPDEPQTITFACKCGHKWKK